jgi:hypothetical protein
MGNSIIEAEFTGHRIFFDKNFSTNIDFRKWTGSGKYREKDL